jgi:hypothetical protein
MAKEHLYPLREFAGLTEEKRPIYMGKHGSYATTNSGEFPGLPNSGIVMSGHAVTLSNLLSLKDRSETDKSNYETELGICIMEMEENYNYINDVADGEGSKIALAGINSTSTNTTSIGAPGNAENVKYVMVDGSGEIQIVYNADKLAMGAVIFTYTDETVVITKTGPMQYKIAVGPPASPVVIMFDLTTTIKTLIQNLIAGSKITSELALFNRNGFSPVLVSPTPVIIPR